jgi:hypothetical protein
MHTRAGVGEAPAGAVSVGRTIRNICRERGVDSVESERRPCDKSGGIEIRDGAVSIGLTGMCDMIVIGLW